MRDKGQNRQSGQYWTKIEIAAVAVIVMLLMLLAAMSVGLLVRYKWQGQPQAVTWQQTPIIRLEPASGPVGESISVYGEGWTSSHSALIYLIPPGQNEALGFAVASPIVDSEGYFKAGFIVPVIAPWIDGGQATIMVRDPTAGILAKATFDVVVPTPATVVTSESTATSNEPTAMPTAVIQPATITPLPAKPSALATSNVNIRSGPGTEYSVSGMLQIGQSAEVTGRSFDGAWMQIRFSGVATGLGWVASRYVTATDINNIPLVQAPPLPVKPSATFTTTPSPSPTSTATPTPPPTSTPTPLIITDWRGEYYPNLSLSGRPAFIRNDVAVNFSWGNSGPAANFPADNFSVRWTRTSNFKKSGVYLFQAWADDGVRLWLDDSLVLDGWQDGSVRLVEAQRQVKEGNHRIRIEYYERGGGAGIKVAWQRWEVPDNQPPLAVTGGPYTVNEGQGLTLDGRGSKDMDGHIVKYEWDLDYNGKAFSPDLKGSTVNTTYPDGPKTIKVALRVTDDKGAVHVAVAPVSVFNVAPMVEAGGPYSGQVGSLITLVGTASDPGSIDQAGLVYKWDFGDGLQANGPLVSHSYGQAGTYGVKLTVLDRDGAQSSDTATVQVVTISQPPRAVINGPSSGLVGEGLIFNGANSNDYDGSIVSYTWNFGDGTTEKGVGINKSYQAPGNYNVTLTVVDNDGLQAQATHQIKIDEPIVINLPPTAIIQAVAVAPVNQIVEFNGSQSFDPEGTPLTFAWDFGDGTTAEGDIGRHTYEEPGEYQVRLTVTDGTGLSENSIHIITINPSTDI